MTHEAADPFVLLDRELAALQQDAPEDTWDPADVESMIDWLEQEFGLVVRAVPAIDAIVRDVLDKLIRRQRIRLVILGPRGGGKTMLAAGLQCLSLRFYGASWTSLGGSLEQAQRLFNHVRAAVARSADLQSFISECRATRIEARNGGSISVHAASEKAVRGEHPRGPSGAGGIALDEASLIDDRIVDAAVPQVASAEPSMVIQLSTLGEKQSGRFWELVESPTARGYTLHRFHVFHVARRCPYDCEASCPAEFFHAAKETPAGPGQPATMEPALCGGTAHQTDGWISIDEIAQQSKDLPEDAFVREFVGRSRNRVGAVYRSDDIAAACVNRLTLTRDDSDWRPRFLPMRKVVGLDWGFAGQTWAAYITRITGGRLAVYRWEYWSGTRFSLIREHLVRRIFEDRISVVMADGASPSDNDDLRAMIYDRCETVYREDRIDHCAQVIPVNFSKEKSYGVGEVRRRLENKELFFPEFFHDTPIEHRDRAVRLLKSYHFDDAGNPAKVDDHVADALLCGVLYWSPRKHPQPRVY